MIKTERCQRVSLKPLVAKPTPEKAPPIRVKVIEIPATIMIGRHLLPIDPAKTAGRIGKIHGEVMERTPARKTSSRAG